MTENMENQKSNLKTIEAFKALLDAETKLEPEYKKVVFEKYVSQVLSTTPETNAQPATKAKGSLTGVFGDVHFAELIKRAGVKKHPDIVLLATYDLMINKGMESVTTAEITAQYKSALLKPSTNTSADIRSVRSKGYMMPGELKDGKASFKITMSGIQYVEEMINDSQ
jgi:hypothetical protein